MAVDSAHYRQLIVWQKAMAAAVERYRLAPLLPREETYGMRSQITRAVVSIAANIAEGWGRETPKDKAYFPAVAQGSLAETDTLHALLIEAGKMLTTMRRRLRNSN